MVHFNKISMLMLVVLFGVGTVAQTPQKLSYQAIVRDSGGELVAGSPVGVQVSIYFFVSKLNKSTVYVETHNVDTNENGLLSLDIGMGTVVLGTFSEIIWGAHSYYVKVEIDPLVGTDYTIVSEAGMGSVPYALHAKTAQSVTEENDPTWKGDADTLVSIGRIGRVGIGTTVPAALLHTRGMETGSGNVLFEGSMDEAEPGPLPVSGAGTRLMWCPGLASFRVGRVTADQWDIDINGFVSFASGFDTRAIGNFSTATGYETIALGRYSTAMGFQSTASGWNATALGRGTVAASFHEMAVGSYNTLYTPAGVDYYDSADRLFCVGNGENTSNRHNALTLLKNGNTGIGIDEPQALLHVYGMESGKGSVLFEGLVDGISPGDPPAWGPGTRMMWYPDKSAFRAGTVSEPYWNKELIGEYSLATGYNTEASGLASVALGLSTRASNSYSIALGAFSEATGSQSTAIGQSVIASGTISTALGYGTLAPSFGEMAAGTYNTNYTPASTSGWELTDRLFSIGNGISNENRSNALTILKNGNTGIGTTDPAGYKLRVVTYASGGTNASGCFENTSESGLALRASTTSSDGTALFIQQGSGYSLRCDGYDPNWFVSMIVTGRKVGINTSSPTQNLDVDGNARIRSVTSGAYSGPVNRTADGTLTTATSDIRLKENIQTLEGGLEKVLRLRGVSFTWKNNPGYGNRVGFIAQEVETVVPELVFTNETDGYKGVNYAEMTAVLVEAIKELKAENERLQSESRQMKNRLSQIETLLHASGDSGKLNEAEK